MNEFIEELQKNPLKTRQDVINAVLQIYGPLKEHYSPGHALLHVGNTGAHYGEKATQMEGFSRILWGLGPLLSQDITSLPLQLQQEIIGICELYREGIIHGTDTKHTEYWGDVCDYDQKMVEMAAIVVAICLAPDKLWEPLTLDQQENLYHWLDKINNQKVHPNNWRFFRILVNMMFRLRGLPWNEENLEIDFEVIEKCYTGDGWYFDGNPGQMDYYIPFAMHYYGLIYAKFMTDIDPQRAETFRKRAVQFADDFIYWFSKDGSDIPFGRSLTYRFAHSAFFSAMAFSGVNGLPWGVIKGVVLKNLRNWLSKPIFDEAGIMTIGYDYPNLIMSERYNSPGSPYWSLKTFLILALKEDHPFWQADEQDFDYEPLKVLDKPHMLIAHDPNSNHVMAFVTGQHCMNHGNSAAKYEKFVYSNQFGFSVSRGNELEDGAFDNTLAVSIAGENFYRMRYGLEDFNVCKNYVYSKYNITSHVRIESFLVPLMPWHVRIHKIDTDIDIDIADGGFAIGIERCFTVAAGAASGKYTQDEVLQTENCLFAAFPWGTSGIVSDSGGSLELVRTYPNTNLFSNVAAIPTFKKRLKAGKHLIVTSVLGDKSPNSQSFTEYRPHITINEDIVRIKYEESSIDINLLIKQTKSNHNLLYL